MNLDSVLKQLEGLTDYPWSLSGVSGQNPSTVVTQLRSDAGEFVLRPQFGSVTQIVGSQNDLDFIAQAPKLVADLLAEVARLQQGGKVA